MSTPGLDGRGANRHTYNSTRGDDGGSGRGPQRHRRLEAGALRGGAGGGRRSLLDDLGARERAALHARDGRDRLRPRPRLPRRLPVHARRLPVDVPRQALDDAPVRGLRHRRGDERALPLPPRARPDGPLDRLRHADADGLRLRPSALARRGRPRGRGGRLARRHGAALRRHPARRGLDVDDFAPRLSFFFNAHLDFFEEIAKYRAARRIWARELRERYGARNPRSWLMRFHTQTAGVSLTAQQPEVNIVRTALEALAAVLGGTQSLHTNSFDEALALPTEHAVRLA